MATRESILALVVGSYEMGSVTVRDCIRSCDCSLPRFPLTMNLQFMSSLCSFEPRALGPQHPDGLTMIGMACILTVPIVKMVTGQATSQKKIQLKV